MCVSQVSLGMRAASLAMLSDEVRILPAMVSVVEKHARACDGFEKELPLVASARSGTTFIFLP